MKHAHIWNLRARMLRHKLSADDIKEKKIPAIRLVRASKLGPPYRLEIRKVGVTYFDQSQQILL